MTVPKKPTPPLEHAEQVAFFQRVDMSPFTKHLPIYAVPNAGGYTGNFKSNVVRATRMKKEGVRRGPPDINVDVARRGYHGLRIEMKRQRGGSLSPDQKAWHTLLREQGYYVEVCYGAEPAWNTLLSYLGIDR